ncbi:MAG: glycosyl hydrolase, partial [Thermoanaerobaculia bacterium]
MKKLSVVVLAILMLAPLVALAAEEDADKPETKLNSDTLDGLALRGIGPSINSGRISDFAVTPGKRHRYFIAVSSGNLWKTDNAGTTWAPVFENEGSYSIGVVTMDPNNPNVIWAGTGENNSQRSVSFGDGVYKSLDGGQSWTHMGLEKSEHIGGIEVDPRDSNVVFVAAQGPLWNSGGERGLYKTIDGGTTWERVL